jgi:hypothetical protein
MQKVIRDGKVAVVYGFSWFTSHGYEVLLYHPKIVELIEQDKRLEITVDLVSQILAIDKEDCPCLAGVVDLGIDWVDEGTIFEIQCHDGEEFIVPYDEHYWLTA